MYIRECESPVTCNDWSIINKVKMNHRPYKALGTQDEDVVLDVYNIAVNVITRNK